MMLCRMDLRVFVFWSSVSICAFTGCEFPEEGEREHSTNQLAVSVPAPMAKRVQQPHKLLAAAGSDVSAITGAGARLTIENASLSIEIESYESWLTGVEKQIAKHEGYLQSVNSRRVYDNVQTGNLVAWIPNLRLVTFVHELKQSALSVEGESRSGRDVSSEFFDLEAHITNKKKTEERFREILADAKSVEEILSVERGLARLRDEIDRLEGRKKHLEERIEMSSVSVDWHEPFPVGSDTKGKGFWNIIIDGFHEGIRGFAVVLKSTIVFSIAAIPVIIALVLAATILRLLWRWRRAHSH